LDFFDVIKNSGSLVAVVLSCVSLGQFLSKRIDKLFDEHLEEIRENDKKQTEEITEIKDTLDNLEKRFNVDEDFNAEICRSAIKDIYYRYNKTQKIPLYERKMADSLYKIYSEQFHQNSYGQLLYQEICKWEIDTTDKLTM
jgi:septal ring factor EnvC (AmiA/AmiB activator)